MDALGLGPVLMETLIYRRFGSRLRVYVQAERSAGYYSQRSIRGGRDIEEWCAWAQE